MSQKQVMPKSEDLSRSLETNAIWTFDTEFPTILFYSCCLSIDLWHRISILDLSAGTLIIGSAAQLCVEMSMGKCT